MTEFQLDAAYLAQFREQVVGSAMHREIWVPSEQMEEFNHHLLGPIAITRAHYGPGYRGPTPQAGALAGTSAREQLPILTDLFGHSIPRFRSELRTQRAIVQLNFAYWVRADLDKAVLPAGRKVRILRIVRQTWTEDNPNLPMVGSDELEGLAETLSQ